MKTRADGTVSIDFKNTWFIGGDPDEIPSAEVVSHFKYCYATAGDSAKQVIFFILHCCCPFAFVHLL